MGLKSKDDDDNDNENGFISVIPAGVSKRLSLNIGGLMMDARLLPVDDNH